MLAFILIIVQHQTKKGIKRYLKYMQLPFVLHGIIMMMLYAVGTGAMLAFFFFIATILCVFSLLTVSTGNFYHTIER